MDPRSHTSKLSPSPFDRAHPSPKGLLGRSRIGKPCDADWSSMQGDERRRHCAECGLGVVMFSELCRAEAEQLLARHRAQPRDAEGALPRLCLRAVVDAEGRPLTREERDALRSSKVTPTLGSPRRAGVLRRIVASLAAVLGLLGGAACSGRERETATDLLPPDPIEQAGSEDLPVLMGEVCIDPVEEPELLEDRGPNGG